MRGIPRSEKAKCLDFQQCFKLTDANKGLAMFHKIINNQVAIPAGDFVHPAQARRSTLTHNEQYNRITGRTDYFINSYFPSIIRNWNSLPQHIVDIQDKKNFKETVKQHIKDSIKID